MNRPTSNQSSGFSLIEIILAMVVIGIGAITILGLFPSGMKANKASIDETEASIFAEETFGMYRTLLRNSTNLWSSIENLNEDDAPAAKNKELWKDASDLIAIPDNNINTVKFQRKDREGNDHTLRYQFEIDALASDHSGRTKTMKLWIWPNEFGDSPQTNALFFYSTIYNHGI